MNKIDKDLLSIIADLHSAPEGSYNIRKNGQSVERKTTAEIDITTKNDKPGIDIVVKPNVVGKSVHIPVIITQTGLTESVYNDFFVGENSDVVIVAGCGIHNPGTEKSEHDGIHRFFVKKGAKVKYIERHYGYGKKAEKVLSPTTEVFLEEGAEMQMETHQIGGVSHAIRKTKATLKDNAKLVIHEKILTEEDQTAETHFDVKLKGKNSSVQVVSRSVAKGNSYQKFVSNIVGENECFGHVECDAILLDGARVVSVPKIDAKTAEASLVHEAAIGKIAGDELIKLKTLGLSQEEAENVIIQGYLN